MERNTERTQTTEERTLEGREEHVCPVCMDTGYVYMGVETEDGEIEEVAYLCRRCEAS